MSVQVATGVLLLALLVPEFVSRKVILLAEEGEKERGALFLSFGVGKKACGDF